MTCPSCVSGSYTVVLLRQAPDGIQVVASCAGDDEVSAIRAFADAADGSRFADLDDREPVALVMAWPFRQFRLALLPRDADWLAGMVADAGEGRRAG